MGADSANPASVYIYNAATKSWSTQSVTTGSFNPTSFVAILDHDTNVFCMCFIFYFGFLIFLINLCIDAISNGELFFLNMGAQTSANSSALAWVDVAKPPFTTTGWAPVMALAQNHIHFLNVPGVPAGSADIFVIHCLSILLSLVSVRVNVFSLQSLSSSQRRKHSLYPVVEPSQLPMDKQHLSSNPQMSVLFT